MNLKAGPLGVICSRIPGYAVATFDTFPVHNCAIVSIIHYKCVEIYSDAFFGGKEACCWELGWGESSGVEATVDRPASPSSLR